MPLLKARVRNERIVLDEPTDLPDSDTVYLQLVEPGDADHDAAWAQVIDRRLQEALDGRVELVDAKVATARMRDELARRRG